MYGCIRNSQRDQLQVGSIAQFIENCTGIVEVMGSNQVLKLDLFIFFPYLRDITAMIRKWILQYNSVQSIAKKQIIRGVPKHSCIREFLVTNIY